MIIESINYLNILRIRDKPWWKNLSPAPSFKNKNNVYSLLLLGYLKWINLHLFDGTKCFQMKTKKSDKKPN